MARAALLRVLRRTPTRMSERLRNNFGSACGGRGAPRPPPSCRFKYLPEIEALINQQIQIENQAAHDYLGMAVYFAHPDVSRPGCYSFFMRMYEEEIEHTLDFVQYQLTRGGVVQIGALCAPPKNCNLSMLDAFKRALAMEHCVTEKLEKIVSCAESKKDHQCADFVTSVFLAEQMRSINELAHRVTRLTHIAGAEHGLYHHDLELLNNYPYKRKKILKTN